ncbi:hypothetical protein JW868_03175 [Candidatus Woesearchaeota archaeon]|nr:hypothetical protein [Candidatus Woesearchaeota archaeon]
MAPRKIPTLEERPNTLILTRTPGRRRSKGPRAIQRLWDLEPEDWVNLMNEVKKIDNPNWHPRLEVVEYNDDRERFRRMMTRFIDELTNPDLVQHIRKAEILRTAEIRRDIDLDSEIFMTNSQREMYEILNHHAQHAKEYVETTVMPALQSEIPSGLTPIPKPARSRIKSLLEYATKYFLKIVEAECEVIDGKEAYGIQGDEEEDRNDSECTYQVDGEDEEGIDEIIITDYTDPISLPTPERIPDGIGYRIVTASREYFDAAREIIESLTGCLKSRTDHRYEEDVQYLFRIPTESTRYSDAEFDGRDSKRQLEKSHMTLFELALLSHHHFLWSESPESPGYHARYKLARLSEPLRIAGYGKPTFAEGAYAKTLDDYLQDVGIDRARAQAPE